MESIDVGVQQQRLRQKGKPIMLRLPVDMVSRLDALAAARSIPVATLVRQLTKERLDQLECERTQPILNMIERSNGY